MVSGCLMLLVAFVELILLGTQPVERSWQLECSWWQQGPDDLWNPKENLGGREESIFFLTRGLECVFEGFHNISAPHDLSE